MRLLQITDLHLTADPAARMQGRVIRESLDAVLHTALENNAEEPDLIVISGDISDEEQAHSCAQVYRYLKDRLKGYGSKIRCIPGNHDRPELLYHCFGFETKASLEADNWQLLFIDSHRHGAIGGKLDEVQLKASLDGRTAENTLLFLHHPPLPIGCLWLDQIKLQNGVEFIKLLAQYQGIKGVVFGHVHQAFEARVAGIRMLGTPATCPRQFLPKANEHKIDIEASPGFRWLILNSNGQLETQVVRI